MKRLFSLLLVLSSLQGSSQQHRWEELKLDSAQFVFQYGTEDQYDYQKKLQAKSRSKMACAFIGAQFMWWYELVTYLSSKNYQVEVSATETEFRIVALASSRKAYPDSAMIATASLNKNGQITKAIITGPTQDIYTLFFDFWDPESLSLKEMATSRITVNTLEGDKVSMKFMGPGDINTIKLMISITPRPDYRSSKFELKN